MRAVCDVRPWSVACVFVEGVLAAVGLGGHGCAYWGRRRGRRCERAGGCMLEPWRRVVTVSLSRCGSRRRGEWQAASRRAGKW